MRIRLLIFVLISFCLNAVGARLPDSINRFSHNLSTRLFSSQKGNICVAGASIHHALAMALMGTGSKSSTRQEMALALRLNPKVDTAKLAASYADMLGDLKLTRISEMEAEPPLLTMANRVVLFNGVQVQPHFLELTSKMGAEAKEFAKGTPANEVLTHVNSWVSEQTHQKIPQILSKLDADEFMVLLNAVYFKGEWSKQFATQLTTNASFTQLDKTTKDVPMMAAKQGSYRHLATNDVEILELPYAGAFTDDKHPRFSMFLVLPTHGEHFAQTFDYFDLSLLDKVAKSAPQSGDVLVPKFKIEAALDMVGILKSMGIQSAFSYGEADFSGITSGDIKINQVAHRTFIDVNEMGTEAAAATAITVGRRCAVIPPPSTFYFKADRPFFFFVRDNSQEVILFEGVVATL